MFFCFIDNFAQAKKHSKIFIATADVKYLDPWDQEIFKSLVYAKGIKNARHYLFDYKKAEEGRLVIPNQRFLTTEYYQWLILLLAGYLVKTQIAQSFLQ
ncbi:hypothetical protein, partial [Mycoplasmopsis bovis]|uniref:hypothetical protein n=1 Tax=Mycoplasmopsis bovis TaxID=28903 RepID=UPI003D28B6B0